MCFKSNYFVLVLLFISVFHGGLGDPELFFTITKRATGTQSCLGYEIASSKLFVDRMARWTVKSAEHINSVKCVVGYNSTIDMVKIKRNWNGYYAEKNVYVGKQWNNNWSCVFNPSKTTCNFKVDIRNKELEPKILVNGHSYPTRNAPISDNFNSYFFYEFQDGEAVNVTCYRNNPLSSIQLSTNVFEDIKINSKLSNQDFLYLKLTKSNDQHFIDCSTVKSFTPEQSFVVRVILQYSGAYYNLSGTVFPIMLPKECEQASNGNINCANDIEGLEKEKILGMYHENMNTLSVLYDYDEDYGLHVNCNKSPKWKYNDLLLEDVNGTGDFKFISNETKSDISCTPSYNTTDITVVKIALVKRPHNAIVDPPSSTTDTDVTPDGISGGGPTLSDDGTPSGYTPETDEPGMSLPAIIGMVVCPLLFLILLAFIVIQLLKKKQNPPKLDSNVNYENLPEHNNGTMPVPSQWQEAQYTAPLDRITNNDYAVPYKPDINEMYATPTPKDQRTQIDNQAYVNENLGPTYAQAIPKKLRKGVAVLPMNPNSTYAELVLKPSVAKKPNFNNKGNCETESPYAEITPSENSYVSVNPYQEINESPYAEVSCSESPYSDPDNLQPKEKKYVNVFSNLRYVNADTKEYAEPAYCEIDKLGK